MADLRFKLFEFLMFGGRDIHVVKCCLKEIISLMG
jgi:hypothetical protein